MSNKSLTKKEFEEILKERDKQRFDKTTKTFKKIDYFLNWGWGIFFFAHIYFVSIVGFMGAILVFAQYKMFHTIALFTKVNSFLIGAGLVLLIYSCFVSWLIKKRERLKNGK